MALEDWIDDVAALWDIGDGEGGLVRSYRVYADDQPWPESLQELPCALSYATDCTPEYSTGGPLVDMYRGVTEFHLFPNTAKINLPPLMKFFARIRNAAAGSMTLSGKVAHFLLRKDVPGIQGPVTLTYGQDAPHLGILANWEVKENVTGDYTPAA
jgi:hypothetical protein